MIDVDVETTGLQPFVGDEMFLAQFSDGTRDDQGELVVEVLRHPQDSLRIQEWLDRDDEFRAWNIKLDMHFLQQCYSIPSVHRWHDGFLLAKLTDERTSGELKRRDALVFGERNASPERALKAWLAREVKERRQRNKSDLYQWLEECGIPQKRNRKPQVPPGMEIPARLRYTPPTYADVPDEIMYPYAREDIVMTRRLSKTFEQSMTDELRSIYELERRTIGALFDMESRGLPIDEPAVGRLAIASAERLEGLYGHVRELAGDPTLNPRASEQIAKALVQASADLSYVERTEGGKLSMDEENLSTIDHPLAQAVLDTRGEAKTLGTYVTPLLRDSKDRKRFIDTEGRVHTSFKQIGARTGRMSSHDPNIQNWPRDDLRLRYLVRADEGKVLVSADMDAIEARLLAIYAGQGRLLHTLQEGGDIHTLTAKMVGLQGRQRSMGFESARQQGKQFNYLVMYGGGVRAIRKWYHVSQAEARRMLDAYRNAYPEIARFGRNVEGRLAQRGYVKTLYGRRQRIDSKPMAVRKEGYKFPNYLIQGTAADLIKHAVSRLHEEGVPLIAVVHDEVLAHVDKRDALRVAGLMREALTDFPEVANRVPLHAEAAIVERWSQVKDREYVPEHEQETR